MKTIFYRPSDNTDGDYWFNDNPYKEWFVLDNFLYEPNGNIIKSTVVGKYVKSIVITQVKDIFSDEGIIRRIALYVGS